MILIDTNIISELMKSTPSHKILAWFSQQSSEDIHISTISIAEIHYGINVLPEGKKKHALQKAFHQSCHLAFQHRIWAFCQNAAECYGNLMSFRKQQGKPMNVLDGQIASIAYTNKAALATRNTKAFVDCQLDIVNPFD